ncbi:hypothetical protein KUV80_10450 [Fictibacillus nanhaiensis]|uniref:hypothetical protein n=1 Tax=Fictibacillus nanhaiensis TaxID=742169 RepID=UPI001C980F0F|nr:hypothetical protein [Fictibacillus nanhaiensis]MBY6037079.1 hypothetical protein [Fictibacillus nanhaiensis]
MKETIHRILKRLKKWFLLLILIPFLTAGTAYLFQKQGPTSYTAKAEIQLASFNFKDIDVKVPEFTDAEYAKIYFTNDILKSLKERKPDLDINSVQSKLNFVIKPAKVLGISYTGDEPKETENTLKLVVNEYLSNSENKRSVIEAILKEGKSLATPESEITASEYELMILDIKNGVRELKEVQLEQDQESSRNTAVFGFLIGLILSSMILLLPEIFRK